MRQARMGWWKALRLTIGWKWKYPFTSLRETWIGYRWGRTIGGFRILGRWRVTARRRRLVLVVEGYEPMRYWEILRRVVGYNVADEIERMARAGRGES